MIARAPPRSMGAQNTVWSCAGAELWPAGASNKASCRAVGSTAPRESTPASISGASASTDPPAVRDTISRTDSSETPCSCDAAALLADKGPPVCFRGA
eukprot:2795773-Prymnesium_polylepis.2